MKYEINNSELIVSSLEHIGETDFCVITEEMCDRLIEKVVIGPYTCNQKKYENFQQTDFYIYGIGYREMRNRLMSGEIIE